MPAARVARGFGHARACSSGWAMVGRAPTAVTHDLAGPDGVRRILANRRLAGEAVADGTVIIIGGAEDKVRDRVILSRFVALAGGRGRHDRRHLDRVVASGLEAASATGGIRELGVRRSDRSTR